MFDIGISEIGLIAVVALIVLGPERLPRVARTVGTLLGRAQRYVNDVKAEVSREIELEELKKLQTEMKEAAASVQQQMTSVGSEVQSAVNEVHSGFEQVGKDMSNAAQSIGHPVGSSADVGSGAALPSPLGPAGGAVDISGVSATEPSAAGPASSSYLYAPLEEPPIPVDEAALVARHSAAIARDSAPSLVDPRAAANVRSALRESDVTTAVGKNPVVRATPLRDPRAAANAVSDVAPTDDADKPVQSSLFQ